MSGPNSYSEPDLLSLPHVARRLGVCETTVRRWIKSGLLPARRVGPAGRYRISEEDAERMIEWVQP